MSWNTTSSNKQNSATKHRGGALNNIYRLLTNINLELTDPSLVPKISTLLKFHGRKLAILDSPSGDHGSYFDNSGLNLDQDQYVRIPEILNTEESERIDTLIMQKQEVALIKKTLDFDEGSADKNIATNIPTTAIADDAITNAKILSVDWTKITGEPAEFTPSAHTHGDADITDVAWGKLTSVPATFTPEAHNHVFADLTDEIDGSSQIADGSIDSDKLLNVLPSPIKKISGRWDGITGSGLFDDMILYGDIVDYLFTGNHFQSTRFQTNAVANRRAGMRKGYLFCRSATNSSFRILQRSGAGSNVTRHYHGYTSYTSEIPSGTTPLGTGDSGAIIGFREGDTNYQVWTNDGLGGAALVTDTGIAVSNQERILELKFTGGGTSLQWSVWNSTLGLLGSGTISTQLPAVSTSLSIAFHVESTSAAAINLYLNAGEILA